MDFMAVIQAIFMVLWQLWAGPVELTSCYDDTETLEAQIERCTELLDTIGKDARSPDDLYNLAVMHVQRGSLNLDFKRYDAAIADANAALSHLPQMGDALYLRALASSDSGQQHAAIEDYNVLLEMFPDDASIYADRGIAHRRSGNFEQALLDYGKAIEIAPNDYGGYHVRAWAYFVKGRHEEALADIDKALELGRGNWESQSTRAHVLYALGRKDEALEVFLDIAKNGPAPLIVRYQKILRLRGYENIEETGVSSPELLSAIERCLRENCNFIFDVEQDQPEQKPPAATSQ